MCSCPSLFALLPVLQVFFFKWDELVQVATKCPVMKIIPVVRNRDQHLRRILRHLPLPAIANAHVNCTEC